MSLSRLALCVALGTLLVLPACREESDIQVYYTDELYDDAFQPAPVQHGQPETTEDAGAAGVAANAPQPPGLGDGAAHEPSEDDESSAAAVVVLIDPFTECDPQNALPAEPQPWEMVDVDRYEHAEPVDTVDRAVTLIADLLAPVDAAAPLADEGPQETARPAPANQGVTLVAPTWQGTSHALFQAPIIYRTYTAWPSVRLWRPTFSLGWAPIWISPFRVSWGRLWPPAYNVGVYPRWIDDFFLGLPPSGWWNYRPGWDPPWVATAHYTWFPLYTSGTYLSVGGFSYVSGGSYLWSSIGWRAGSVGHRRHARSHRAGSHRSGRRAAASRSLAVTSPAVSAPPAAVSAGRPAAPRARVPSADRSALRLRVRGRRPRNATEDRVGAVSRASVYGPAAARPKPTLPSSTRQPRSRTERRFSQTALPKAGAGRSGTTPPSNLVRPFERTPAPLRRYGRRTGTASVPKPRASTTPLVRPLEEAPAPPTPRRSAIRRRTGSGVITYTASPIRPVKAGDSPRLPARRRASSEWTRIPSTARRTVPRRVPRIVPSTEARTRLAVPWAPRRTVSSVKARRPTIIPRTPRVLYRPTSVKSLPTPARSSSRARATNAGAWIGRPVSSSGKAAQVRRSTPAARATVRFRAVRPASRTVNPPVPVRSRTVRTPARSRSSLRSSTPRLRRGGPR